MDEILREAFRHAAWASRTLLDACRAVPHERLVAPARGFGSILATLDHFVRSDAAYVATLTGDRPAWIRGEGPATDLDVLAARVDDTAARWERLLSEPFDAERELLLDAGTYTCRASLLVVQALHHGAAHREQVRAALVASGQPAPDLQPWAFADATGRARTVRDAR